MSLPASRAGTTAASPAWPFGAVLAELRASTAVPILLPSSLPTDDGRLYADIIATSSSSYEVEFAPVPRCHGVRSCTDGSIVGFTARSEWATEPQGDRLVKLANGAVARFEAPICGGAGCSDGVFSFRRGDASYEVRVKAGRRPELLRLANAMRRY